MTDSPVFATDDVLNRASKTYKLGNGNLRTESYPFPRWQQRKDENATAEQYGRELEIWRALPSDLQFQFLQARFAHRMSQLLGGSESPITMRIPDGLWSVYSFGSSARPVAVACDDTSAVGTLCE